MEDEQKKCIEMRLMLLELNTKEPEKDMTIKKNTMICLLEELVGGKLK